MIIPHSAIVEGAAKKERKFKENLIKEKFNNFNAPADAEGGWFLYNRKKWVKLTNESATFEPLDGFG